MARISIDNGHSYTTPEDALQAHSMETIVNYMDDDTREAAHREIAPGSDTEFLARYLELAAEDLIIG